MRVLVQEASFDLGSVTEAFADAVAGAGAVVTFTGVVRDADTGDMAAMEIEHYPGMTQKALEKIASEAMTRWDLADALVIHRYGRLEPGERIMMVATAARHRKDAFEAAEFLMDYLKSRAPFWKKEVLRDGEAEWVAAKDADEDALKRW
ncbi:MULTISPECIES: molybdenum cofactor biosynthesis protein MoaE [Rhodobacterales]|jgi:molybdopterin synthase catalytic subunit|uniref:Molybdopterin synthase catalytic subunit n=1 Tax=Phaeobacter gallaeciensis TaxID=60890 RepID=A0A1B0ZQ70_9RHOB|nr:MULTISPECIES: molybdenum cofactor biosynthesis protein MoaE [Phaeobacter]MDF1772181.1 molybdenum cofactor biosynthesis protein MoaE [Pseudophaeobacter sp. bin_em_oilr2.035]ANP36238.1 molybdenum cofactor biosynthesis protein MoaE [Phaeobacter gallaeciensis]MDE4060711.1 molybdenum cofactor biosynthesis protein MoaE [Phaeobacter gallaeciensis]MDE4123862.1 molybdenum cofactor biosynthesis protein MoaE [Phaeobacter gallaeciensis]MDE4128200.1 molybdenum cofactor biosynthesis protein MoaE [Phaeoba